MSNRGQFLERVRRALGHSAAGSAHQPAKFPSLGQVLAPVADKNPIDRFQEELKKVGGISHNVGSPAGLDGILREILSSAPTGPIVLSRNPLLTQLRLAERLQSWGYSVVAWPRQKEVTANELEQFRTQCFNGRAGISGADFALVESGSFVLSSATEGSQLVSLAPPLHIVLYLRSQVVETLEEVLSNLLKRSPAADAGRSIVFITGQSRTADIEQISIRGVHGPLNIHAILVEDSCLSAAVNEPAYLNQTS
jgi:L-lactate dehydrogenase complex protein LldG